MSVPPLRNFDQVRRAIQAVQTRLDEMMAKLDRSIAAKDDGDEFIRSTLIDAGVRIARVTEHIPGTTDISDVSHGGAQLVNIYDYASDSDRIVPAYNVTEKEYTIGTLIALLPIQGSFFVASDPGVFAATVLPLVEFSVAPGDTYLELTAGSDTDLSQAAPPFAVLSDAYDGVDTGADEYTLEIECINGVLQFDPGDSDVTSGTIGDSNIQLFGTLDALNDFFAGNTTGFLNINPPVPGADSIRFTLTRDSDSRTGTYGFGTLATPAPGTTTTLDVQVFPASGTWTKPANAVTVHVHLVGGGGGGGSGRRGNTGTLSAGGGGGGGGAYKSDTFDADDLSGTETVTIGAGGGGGAGGGSTGSDGDGNAGSAGGSTTFGAHLTANGGSGGGGGTSSAAGSGGAGGTSGTENGGAGGNGAATGAATSAGSPTTGKAGGGGGGGAGITSGNALQSASSGASSAGRGGRAGFGIGAGTTDTISAVPGEDGQGAPILEAFPAIHLTGGGGAGGGGSSTSNSGTPANFGFGGNGGFYGAGGGGGGGCRRSSSSVNPGGSGAPGFAVVVTECVS